MTPPLKPDHVQELKDALIAAKSAEEASLEALRKLHAQAMEEVRLAFGRVFPSGVKFPKGKPESAIPHTGDNLRIDFPTINNVRLKVSDLIDSSTGISFNGFQVDAPVRGVHLQVRVPLKHLSPNGIEKV